MPSIHGRVTYILYQDVIDIVASKLGGWKANYLSFASRQILAQLVFNAIPLYSIQLGIIPIRVCNKVEASIRSFLWGGDSNHWRISLVN